MCILCWPIKTTCRSRSGKGATRASALTYTPCGPGDEASGTFKTRQPDSSDAKPILV